MPTPHRRPPSQKPRASVCPTCRSTVLSAQVDGLWTLVEPHVLDDHAEATAIADGVHTFNRHPGELSRRVIQHIWSEARLPRHAEHVCGRTYGRPAEPAFELIAEVAPAPTADDAPPF